MPHRLRALARATALASCAYALPPAAAAQSFTPAPAVFDGAYFPAVAFDDLDGDGAVDLLLAGADSVGTKRTTLYLGDGAGGFAKAPRQPFAGVMYGSVATIDVEGDGDRDVLLTGQLESRAWTTRLYLNDGGGAFVEVDEAAFADVREGALAVADVDDDGDADVMLAGGGIGDEQGTQLYLNDGRGFFSVAAGTEFVEAFQPTVAFADLDGDGDEDLVIGGTSWPVAAERYRNEGDGRFARVEPLPYEGTSWSAMALGDLDGDGDPDAVLSGERGTSGVITDVYRNIGRAGFTPVDNVLPDLFLGGVALGDVDGDGDLDVALTGGLRGDDSGSITPTTALYLNDGLGYFEAGAPLELPQVYLSAVALADVNDDGALDLFVAGNETGDVSVARLYLNDVASGVGEAATAEPGLRLWPSPVGPAGILRFSVEGGEPSAFEVIDAAGRRMLVGDAAGRIDVGALAPGVYVLRVAGGGQAWFTR